MARGRAMKDFPLEVNFDFCKIRFIFHTGSCNWKPLLVIGSILTASKRFMWKTAKSVDAGMRRTM
jgi:hypothetical protein